MWALAIPAFRHPTAEYALRAYLQAYARAPRQSYAGVLDSGSGDIAVRALACCAAARIDWC